MQKNENGLQPVQLVITERHLLLRMKKDADDIRFTSSIDFFGHCKDQKWPVAVDLSVLFRFSKAN